MTKISFVLPLIFVVAMGLKPWKSSCLGMTNWLGVHVSWGTASLLDQDEEAHAVLRDPKELRKVLSNDPSYVVEFYSSLLSNSSFSEKLDITTHEDNSISVQVAWSLFQDCLRGIETEVHNVSKFDSQYFIGFMEGRNRLVVPDWWAKCVNEIEAPSFFVTNLPSYQKTHFSEVRCPIGSSITNESGVVTYRCLGDSIELPSEIFEEAGGIVENVVGAFTKENFFVTTHDNFGHPHKLYKIDRTTRKIVWCSRVCGCLFFASSGVSSSHVSVVPIDEGRVAVFGATWEVYAHVFQISDGASLFQFSSGYERVSPRKDERER